MSDAFAQFEKRLDSLERKHRELAKGYVAKINPDGLITVEPKKGRTALRLRVLAAAIIGFVFFKAVTLAAVGPATYAGRIEALSLGTSFERACAWIMQVDPVTSQLAGLLLSVLG